MSDSETDNVCAKCGEPDPRDDLREQCPICKDVGPWCQKCLTHHEKHHREEDGEDLDISVHSACSTCEDLEEDEESGDDDFIDKD